MSGPGGPGPGGGKLDINRAGVSELEGALSGIGRRRARGIVRKREELKGFNSLDDLLHVKGVTTRILELNSQRMTCRRRPLREDAPGGSPSQQGANAHMPQVLAVEDSAQAAWESEESDCSGVEGGSGPESDGSAVRVGQEPEELGCLEVHAGLEPASSRVCGAQEEEEEDEEGSCCSDEGEDGGDVYFYYTIGERWIDYLERTEEGSLIRHVRPKMKRKSENGLDSRALSPGKKLCKGSEYSRTLGPCIPSPTTTFGDLRNAKPGQARRRRIPSLAPPPELQDWLRTFQRWSAPEKLLALDQLIDRCEPSQIKYMMQVIEPQFQRDFISLLPKELALYVLSFLEPRDLLRAAQTCRYWRVLAEDNLLWREKCREEGIEEPLNLRKRRLLSPGFMYSPWKFAFMRQHKIDMNWRSGDLKAPKASTTCLGGRCRDPEEIVLGTWALMVRDGRKPCCGSWCSHVGLRMSESRRGAQRPLSPGWENCSVQLRSLFLSPRELGPGKATTSPTFPFLSISDGRSGYSCVQRHTQSLLEAAKSLASETCCGSEFHRLVIPWVKKCLLPPPMSLAAPRPSDMGLGEQTPAVFTVVISVCHGRPVLHSAQMVLHH
ncbi:F-box/WD repeat-containing protein 7-like isoform X2 [Emydura macquarii macquarii]|uniref:F-box/WD repeat-containing protein 7-like isoform X2 n=1 Tax=Emydura macquarii macquarii TaxID=1129001 RepID=UPI00352A7CC8